MDINLCYVEGISYIDTPYFSNITAQHTYFYSKVVRVIESTFYPPHYRNTIRVEVSDIDFTSQTNYLYFEYNSKVYYYFINKITYINETIIELDIVLDVIQTFMFNIYIANGIIDRKFINRWDGNNYNRNYIRENVSDGLFTNQRTKFYQKDTWLIVVQSEFNSGGVFSQNLAISALIKNTVSKVMTPYFFYCIPVDCRYITYTKLTTGGTSGTPVLVEHQIVDNVDIRNMLSDANTLNSFIVQGNPFPDIFSVVEYNNSIELVVNSQYASLEATTIDLTINKGSVRKNSMFAPFEEYHKIDNSHFDAIQYINTVRNLINDNTIFNDYKPVKNTNIQTIFNVNNIPALIDENYLRIELGDGGGVTTYPLFNINNLDNLHFAYYLNMDEGCYTYSIEGGNQTLNTGLDYNTYCYSNIKASMTLLNDAWKTYQANNQGRWISAGIGAVKNALQFFAPIPSKGAYVASKLSTLMADPNRFDKRYKNPTIKSSYARKIGNLKDSNPLDDLETIAGGMNSMPLTSQAIQDYNAFMSPDSIRMSGDAVSALITSQFIIRIRTLSVNDYLQCGNYYHRNGYKVNEYVNSINNIFTYVCSRYYFNVLKVSDCDLHLHNYIENEYDIEAIKDRLKDGIRLWNVNRYGVSIGDFTYDNVELDYLNG